MSHHEKNTHAELVLLDLVKDNKNKHSYVTTKLNELSRLMNEIEAIQNTRTIKYLITLTFREIKNNVPQSQLNPTEQSFLCNALHTRCIKKLIKY